MTYYICDQSRFYTYIPATMFPRKIAPRVVFTFGREDMMVSDGGQRTESFNKALVTSLIKPGGLH
jgi:hypothetical protein